MNEHDLIRMIRREPPIDQHIVEHSTPVVSFGNFKAARVATLGINPSKREFFEKDVLLVGAGRRLATLKSLTAQRLSSLNKDQIDDVWADCSDYFNRNPYKRWFAPLDYILQEGLGQSYYGDGLACHLDLPLGH